MPQTIYETADKRLLFKKAYNNQLIPMRMANGTSKMVPKIIPSSRLSPQRTPAYFL
jgi:hypothetical protein